MATPALLQALNEDINAPPAPSPSPLTEDDALHEANVAPPFQPSETLTHSVTAGPMSSAPTYRILSGDSAAMKAQSEQLLQARADCFSFLARLQEDRFQLLRQFGLDGIDMRLWSPSIFRLISRASIDCRRTFQTDFLKAVHEARARDILATVNADILSTKAGVHATRNEAFTLLESFRSQFLVLPEYQRETLVAKLDAIREEVSTSVTGTRPVITKLADLRSCLRILLLPQEMIDALIDGLPIYTSDGEVRTRLDEAVRALRRVVSRSQTLDQLGRRYVREAAQIHDQGWGNVSTARRQVLISQYEALYDDAQPLARAQAEVFALFQAELENARSMPVVFQTSQERVTGAEVIGVLAAYDAVREELADVQQGHAHLRRMIREVAQELEKIIPPFSQDE
ncbi:hypothetical protein FKP32DRAFT_1678126 [Trametes sanguinea]|nr:hypothetical protein FKP32DRAFT_1678126 [Trametes sanguinea]